MALNSETVKLWFQKWHEELGELSLLEHPKVWKLYIDGLFLSKAYTVSVRKFQRNCVSWHWRVLQNLNENWCRLQNDIRNLVNFYASSWKSKNWHFDWICLSKVHKYLDEKVPKNYVSWRKSASNELPFAFFHF